MDTLQQGAAPMALADMPMTADGTILDYRLYPNTSHIHPHMYG